MLYLIIIDVVECLKCVEMLFFSVITGLKSEAF